MKTSSSGHLPTPWEQHVDGVYLVIDSAAAGKRIGVMKYIDGVSKERDANAAFIVEACNAHDNIVAALKALLREVGNIEVLGEWSALDQNNSLQRSTRARIDSVVANARAALAKVSHD